MKKREYIFNMTSLILNRVRFHSPKTIEPIDFNRVIKCGVDPTYPVFVFEKPLTKTLAKCFEKALNEEKFNFVMPRFDKYAKNLPVIISTDRELKKLNINYSSGLKFDLNEKQNYIKINNKVVNQTMSGFFKEGFDSDGEICYFTRQFMLSGRNIMVEITNLSSCAKEVPLQISMLLKKGYYCFQRLFSSIKITNLKTFERNYFNFSSFNNSFSFSCVDGVENSCFARIYLKTIISLRPKQRKILFFNLGSEKFSLSTKEEIEKFMSLANQKMGEIFDLRIECEDKKRQAIFNNILPEKIISAWLDGEKDFKTEVAYSLMKEKLCGEKEGLKYLQKNKQNRGKSAKISLQI